MNYFAPKSPINNFVSNSYKTATANSVLEKFKTLGNAVTMAPETAAGSRSNDLIWIVGAILRYTIALLLLAFIILNILFSMKMLAPELEVLFKPFLLFWEQNEKSVKTDRKAQSDNTAELNTAIPKDPSGNANAVYEANKQAVGDKVGNKVGVVPVDANKLVDQLPLVVHEPKPNETGSSKSQSKAGYCYVGIDRGYRSCVKVGEDETCMSGDIFPSMDICINPSLR